MSPNPLHHPCFKDGLICSVWVFKTVKQYAMCKVCVCPPKTNVNIKNYAYIKPNVYSFLYYLNDFWVIYNVFLYILANFS